MKFSRISIFGALALAASAVACADAGTDSFSEPQGTGAQTPSSQGKPGYGNGTNGSDAGVVTSQPPTGFDGGGIADDGAAPDPGTTGSTDGGAPPAADGGKTPGQGGGGGAPTGGGTGAGTGGGGGGPTGGPADLFPSDSYWYKDVSALAPAAESGGIIDAIGSWGTGRFMIDFSINFLHASASDPRVNYSVDWTQESDLLPVPLPPKGSLESESGYSCTQGGDCHLIVVDDAAHKLFELYSADSANGKYTASQETVWDLTKHYGTAGRGYGCTSADAAGMSVMAGLIGLRETKAGDIRHALRFILPNAKIRKGPSFIYPATHGTSATKSAGGPPYGTRLRLKPGFDESTIKSAGGKAIVRALKKYGMILADGGNYALTAEDEKFEKAADPSLTWDGLLGGADVAGIQPSDFEVVDFGAIRTDNDCVRAN